MTMRTFVAVELPNEVKRAIWAYIEVLEAELPDVKWVKPDNMHLTLKFLGEVPERRRDILEACLDQAAREAAPFTVELAHLGFFPARNNPKVVWIGAHGGVDHLIDLFQELEACLEGEGFDREVRTFSPHLTIGRVKRNARVAVPELLPVFDEIAFDIDRMVLIKSTLTPEGPIYEKLHECPFLGVSAE